MSVEHEREPASSRAPVPPPIADRPNEAWWRQFGGEDWLREFERRRPSQPHYAQQESFLMGFFAGLPEVRVLDYGSGFGRHLKNLRQLPNVQIHGCDISEKMIATSAAYLGDPGFVAERVTQIDPRVALPYPDGHFDVVMTSEVLIHVSQVDLPPILRELWRVSKSLVVHVENPVTSPGRRENDAHDGCWLHDFRTLYREMMGVPVEVLPHAVQLQCVYIAAKPTAPLRTALVATTVAEHERVLNQRLAARLEEIHELSARADESERAWRFAEQRLVEFRRTPGAELLRRVRHSKLAQLAGRARRSSPAQVVAGALAQFPGLEGLEDEVLGLPFGGFANAASLQDPQAFLKARPEVVVLCHPEWRGIRAATYGQSEYVLEVAGIQDDGHASRLAAFLKSCGTKTLVINGYPPNIDRLALAIQRSTPDIDAHFVYHGTPAQFHFSEGDVIEKVLTLIDRGALKKLGFVKKGLAEYFRGQGYRAEYVMNVLKGAFSPPRLAPGPDGKLHIGVFGSFVCHKNVETQLMAALMVPGTVAHLADHPVASYLKRHGNRIVSHGIQPRERFLELLRTMHVTTYASLVECYPMTVLESLAAGAPVVTSHTSGIFDSRPDLFEKFVVTAHDEPLAIAKKISWLLDRRSDLIPEAQAFIKELNAQAERRWAEFVSR